MTSGVRDIVPPQLHFQVNSSMNGLCGSKSSPSVLPDRLASSSYEPIASACELSRSQTQIGSGVPQYRSRETAQSMLSVSQAPKRRDPVSGGCQSTRELRTSIESLNSVVRMNQEVRA